MATRQTKVAHFNVPADYVSNIFFPFPQIRTRDIEEGAWQRLFWVSVLRTVPC